MDWSPTLTDRDGPVYQRIVDALSADIASGRLHRGQQLPTHRALAQALGVDLTTVTRAYTEARQRGLTEARVGRGTFVAESLSQARPAAGAQPPLDLSMNLPPQPIEADLEGRLSARSGSPPISTTASPAAARPSAPSARRGCAPASPMRAANGW